MSNRFFKILLFLYHLWRTGGLEWLDLHKNTVLFLSTTLLSLSSLNTQFNSHRWNGERNCQPACRKRSRVAHLPASAPAALTPAHPTSLLSFKHPLRRNGHTSSPGLRSPRRPPARPLLSPRRHEQPPHGKRPSSPSLHPLLSSGKTPPPPQALAGIRRASLRSGAARSALPAPPAGALPRPGRVRRRSQSLVRGIGGSGGGVIVGGRDCLSRAAAGRNAGRAVEGTRPGVPPRRAVGWMLAGCSP